jgi:hypothetical protein
VRARIDLDAGDRESFERHATLCAGQWRSGERRLLGAKYQRLVQFGSEADPSVLDEVPIVTQFTSTLENCHNANQRARCGLEFLGRQSGALGGALYTNTVVGLVRVATFGDEEIDEEMDDWAMEYFAREANDEDDGTEAHSDPPAAKAAGERTIAGHKRVVPVLLTHQSDRGFAITGVALLITLTETPFIYPSRIAAELSKSVALAGDVVPTYT